MLIHLAGRSVRADEILLFDAGDVSRYAAAIGDLRRCIAQEERAIYSGDKMRIVEHAYTAGTLPEHFEADAASRLHEQMQRIHALESRMCGEASEFHWTEIADVESGNPYRYAAFQLAPETGSGAGTGGRRRFIHDGGDFLLIRDGSEGTRLRVRIAAIEAFEYQDHFVKPQMNG